ncbi:MAG: hypothetical protein HYV07_21380 [Deltaproteobacteria bacterium]|nr:hypothetical protein [Deltaproteobacteria bacterium]
MRTKTLITVIIASSTLLAATVAAEPVAGEPSGYQKGPGPERDHECLVCHAGIGEKKAPKLDIDTFHASVHGQEGCLGCHGDVMNESLRHEEEDEDLAPVRCGLCHEATAKKYESSIHGKVPADSKRQQATCARCHGDHDITLPKDPKARVHPINQRVTCGVCHGEDRIVAGHKLEMGREFRAVLRGADSQKVESLMDRHALVSAGCADCHSSHSVVGKADPSSEIYPGTVVETCGRCHEDEVSAYVKSAHGKASRKPGFSWELDGEGNVLAPGPDSEGPVQPPVCSTCHLMHKNGNGNGKHGERSAAAPHSAQFRLDVVKECGHCHQRLMETYPETYHGKATLLGDASVAKCSDCHTAHDNLPASDPESSVSDAKRGETCRKCHEGASDAFARFWPHGDPHDREKYPALFWVFAFMTTLLISVFTFFGAHTIMWIVREAIDAKRQPVLRPHGGHLVRRFALVDRLTHLAVIVSFLGLAATGAPLKFAHAEWARILFEAIGGVAVAGLLHRIFAVITFGYFAVHLIVLASRLLPLARQGKLIKTLVGPESLVPRLEDAIDVFNQFKYFLGKGPKPTWDRWTYWEKFDYWAVFWGVAIIGSSGLMLWFPTFFTQIIPGWVLNIALVVHSDEALLAIGFIFGIHFFNSHLRRSKFPMDPVIFTGSLSEAELKEERGRQWARISEGKGNALERVEPLSSGLMGIVRVFGISAWIFGLVVLAFIVHGFFFA